MSSHLAEEHVRSRLGQADKMVMRKRDFMALCFTVRFPRLEDFKKKKSLLEARARLRGVGGKWLHLEEFTHASLHPHTLS